LSKSHNMQETSLDAYFSEVLPTLGERHQQVLKIFINMELSDELDWSVNRVTPRVFELRGMGKNNPLKNKPILVKSELRPCRITKRMVNAWGLNYERFS